MSSDRVTIDNMAAAIMEGLNEYADLASDDLMLYNKNCHPILKDFDI